MFSNDPTRDIRNKIHQWSQHNAYNEMILFLLLLKQAFGSEHEHGAGAKIETHLNSLSKKITKLTRTVTKQGKALGEGITDCAINVKNTEWQLETLLVNMNFAEAHTE